VPNRSLAQVALGHAALVFVVPFGRAL
jgi:hypothetical protein